MSEFQDKVVLITGAASGFGKLLAERMAAKGAKLFLTDINEAKLESVAQSIGANGTEVGFQKSDVSNKASNQSAVSACVEQLGRIDLAVNNAGAGSGFGSFLDITEEEYDLMQAINAKGVLFGMQAQLAHMLEREGGGRILNVSSMAGLGGAPKIGAYAAAKHAVVGLTKTAAVEFAKSNICINAICPFFSPTPLLDPMDDQAKDFLANGSPMKRLGEPEEIVTVMETLLLPSNSYMTGQCIAVDGGVSAF